MNSSRVVFSALIVVCVLSCGRVVDRMDSTPRSAPAMPVSPPPVVQGGSVGNGGDDLPGEADSAWFLGRRKIKMCYEVSRDFGVGRAEIESAISQAIAAWASYIEEREINSPTAFRDRKLLPGDPEILLDYVLQSRCDASSDLTFYFGVENPVVRRYRSQYHHPLAFAQRLSYDAESGWGNGFIWFAGDGTHSYDFPKWKTRSALKAMIMHEIGHVLGCAHVVGTIMDANFVEVVRKSHWANEDDEKKTRLDVIDRVRILALPLVSSAQELAELMKVEGVRMAGIFPGFDYSTELIRGDLVLQTALPVHVRPGVSSPRPAGQTHLRIIHLGEIDRQRNDARIFKMAFLRRGKKPVLTTVFSHTESISYMGAILPWDRGAEIPVILRFNGDQYHLRIYTWGGDGRAQLVLEF